MSEQPEIIFANEAKKLVFENRQPSLAFANESKNLVFDILQAAAPTGIGAMIIESTFIVG